MADAPRTAGVFGKKMATFDIPALATDRLLLRALEASDLDAYASMQANPKVMRFLVDGRTHTRVEVWRTMASYLGQWPLRGYGMWACAKPDSNIFVGSIGIFQPLDWPEPELAYALDQPFWGQGLATEAATAARDWLFQHSSLPRLASFIRPDTGRRSASQNGSVQSMSAHSTYAVRPISIGFIIGRRGAPAKHMRL